MPSEIILNINVPPSNIAGIAITKLGTRRYKNTFDKRKDPRGKIYYWLAGEVIEEPLEPDSDVWAIKNNFLSITPIKLNLTNLEFIDILKKWDL
jgi:5'-nucleotidase